MQRLTQQQLATLVLLTVVWGLNWPVMKLGVSNFAPLGFRALSIWLGLPVLGLALVLMKVPFRVPRRHWRELAWLTVSNMLIWHVCIILAVKALSSGRAAILGYTMPIFSAVIGAMVFSAVLSRRAWLGVGAAALGVSLLLWHEFTSLAGRPGSVALALFAAAVWALGTQLLRRSKIDLPTLTLSFWMTVIAGLTLSILTVVFERDQWQVPRRTGGLGHCLQRRSDFWVCARRVVLSRAFAAAGRFDAERDVHSRARRIQRRPVAGRSAALAGLGGRGADGGGHRFGAVAGQGNGLTVLAVIPGYMNASGFARPAV